MADQLFAGFAITPYLLNLKFAAGRNHGNRAPWPEFIRRAATILEWEPTAKSPDLQEPREWGAGIPIKYARNRNPRKRVFVLQGVSCFSATGPLEIGEKCFVAPSLLGEDHKS